MDIEYCFKLHLHHYDLIRINDLVLDHNEADLTEISIFKKKSIRTIINLLDGIIKREICFCLEKI